MKKSTLLLLSLLCLSTKVLANPANLMQVYNQALTSDPTYQQAIAQQLSTGQGVPISLAALLPNAGLQASPTLSKSTFSGAATQVEGMSDTTRGYTITLSVAQTIFDFGKFANLAGAESTAKEAIATLNASQQDLMIRVAQAYFQVLQDQDNLISSESSKTAYAKQLDQSTQQYKVGLKTITDVYTAQASYQSSVADYIATENTLANDKENLRAITGKLYPTLATLSERFPLISPHPTHVEIWVQTAQRQNWQIKADQFAVDAARHNIKQQFAGHLPTLDVEGQYNVNFTHDFGARSNNTILNPPGSSTIHNSTVSLNLNLPIFSGGGVVAQTHKAQYDYQVSAETLEKQIRTTMNLTRQSYLNIISGISKIAADRQAIKSAKSSLEGMEAGYHVGTATLVDVLNQQNVVFQDEKQYAADRYAYVNNILALKQATGTLSTQDLIAINAWLDKEK